MTQYRRSALQAVAVAAFVATAALAITLTRPQPVTLTETTSACRAAALRAWVGIAADDADLTSTGSADAGVVPRVSSAGTARTDVYTIEFTNVSGHACSLYGYPGVSAYDAGHLIGSPAMLDTSIRPSTVMLAPGETAHAVLHFIFAAIFREAPCDEVTAPALSIYPPDAGRAMLIPVPMPACSRKGADYLSVQPVQPRAGIPGFPHY
jgi:hypothetical protein